MLKYLRLGNLLVHWEDYLKLAADKNFSHARWLTHVLEQEYQRKRENARQLRLKHAHLPEILVIDRSDYSSRAPAAPTNKWQARSASWDCPPRDRAGS